MIRVAVMVAVLVAVSLPVEGRPVPVSVDHGTDCAGCAGAWAVVSINPHGCADCTTQIKADASLGPRGADAGAAACPPGRGQPCIGTP